MYSTTIYVGNIQSIKDEQLREYFQRFGQIEALYHNCTRAADEWLIDYRFIRFTSDTNMNAFLNNKIDHMICRICLDIHSYDAAFRDETRLTSDRKICIAHTNPKLDRNVVKKAFNRYGRILNCICVSTGNDVEHVYIEFDTVNAIQAVFANKQQHFAGRTSLAVRKPLRPSEVEIKKEAIMINEKPISRHSSHYTDTAQYSSYENREKNLRLSTPLSNQSSNSLLELSTTQQSTLSNYSIPSTQLCSQEQLKTFEKEYNLVIRQDFDEITYQIEKFLQEQNQSYKKIRRLFFKEHRSYHRHHYSDNEEGEIDSSSSSSSSSSHFENLQSIRSNKRIKSHRH